jgi:glucosamine--fructose-6-phosphate aminotransferase (isomerizing)
MTSRPAQWLWQNQDIERYLTKPILMMIDGTCLENRGNKMCGIIGILSKQSVAPMVVESLKLLEYRGYDSAGVAILSDGHLEVKKDVGKISEIEAKYGLSKLVGNIAIGHTRWATHGSVTQTNAHPHCDCSGHIAVVHNGIIENYRELKRQLVSRGHRFVSETDTEVIPHLIEEEIGNGTPLELAVLAIASKLEGSYAFLAIASSDPGKIVGTRKKSPLIVGKNSNQVFVASDALAFATHVKEVISLGDGELVSLTEKGAHFFDNAGNRLQKRARQFSIKWNNVNKNGHRFFMLKEIMEQPRVIAKTIDQDKNTFIQVASDIMKAKQVIITACGTSRYAALVGRYYFSRVARKFCDVVMASEFQYFADSINKNTLVISVSQSGETADVIEGVKRAKSAGAKVISIINRPQSLLAEMSDQVIYLNSGPELSVVATKSFLGQLVSFYLLSFAMVNSFDDAANNLKYLNSKMAETIKWNSEKLKKLSNRLKDKNDIYCIARGINFAIASEGALKLKEISYIHAEGMPAGELKHGTLALIENGTPVIVLCPSDYTFQETLNNAMEAKSRGAYLIGISDVNDELYDVWIKIPKVAELLYPMVTVVPLQLLAYYLAISKGYDPDRPRNLAKSVTVP